MPAATVTAGARTESVFQMGAVSPNTVPVTFITTQRIAPSAAMVSESDRMLDRS